jgi:CTP:molybdopterin cytidylyltransferase MocA
LLLAAGSGRRFGRPKALVDTGDGPWVLRALRTLGGLTDRIVVVGAAAEQVTALLPDDVTAAYNPEHAGGMGSSLAVGLRALPPDADAALVMLVDLPDVPAAAVQRVVDAAREASGGVSLSQRYGAASGSQPRGDSGMRGALARASYRGTPGHPVLIGADHVPGVLASAGGDRGARDYLAGHTVTLVECGDLAGGDDVDVPPGTGVDGQPGTGGDAPPGAPTGRPPTTGPRGAPSI